MLNPYLELRLSRLGADELILDLGCGRGLWLERMARAGLRAVGVEHERARAATAGSHGPVAVGDAEHLPARDGSVGLVWCIHVLHHLDDPGAALAEIRRVLRPGGHLILAETVEDHPVIRLARSLEMKWDGVPVRSRFRAESLVDQLAGAGLEVLEHRQHSLVSFAAWLAPGDKPRMWRSLSRWEDRLPRRWNRWGAHLECVALAQ